MITMMMMAVASVGGSVSIISGGTNMIFNDDDDSSSSECRRKCKYYLRRDKQLILHRSATGIHSLSFNRSMGYTLNVQLTYISNVLFKG